MKPPPFRYERPHTLEEALALLAEHGDDARPLAGGQSLVPMLNLRLSTPAVLVDLNALPGQVPPGAGGGSGGVRRGSGSDRPEVSRGLGALMRANGHLVVGALVRQRELELSPEAAAIGALADGLPLVGHVATRNRGTVGGSIAHADPAAELPLALLALGGSVIVDGPGGRRTVPADELFTGFLSTSLQPGQLVVEVRFPTPGPGEASALLEVAQRHGDFPLAAVAVALRLDDAGDIASARIAAGAVADRPLLLPEAADALTAGAGPEETARIAATLVDPAGSLHAPPDYQRHLVSVLVARAVDLARRRAGSTTPDTSQPQPRSRPTPAVHGQCTVNGRAASLEGVPGRRLLSDFLRHDLGLRGTHVGCEHGVCGACTVQVDGVAVRSCLLFARQVEGSEITTVEGLASAGTVTPNDGSDDAAGAALGLSPLQDAFRRHFALQCGFCTAGILMAAAERLDAPADPPDETEIRQLLSGHLCRCTGYEPIVDAIAEVAGCRAGLREDPRP